MPITPNLTGNQLVLETLAVGNSATFAGFTATRVPGGWVFNNSASACFVPYSQK